MDERAWFEGAYAQYADFLYRIGHRLLAGRSEDVLCDAIQDVFLTMWNKRAELTAHPNLGGWLVTALKFRLRTDSRRAAKLRRLVVGGHGKQPLPLLPEPLGDRLGAQAIGVRLEHADELRA